MSDESDKVDPPTKPLAPEPVRPNPLPYESPQDRQQREAMQGKTGLQRASFTNAIISAFFTLFVVEQIVVGSGNAGHVEHPILLGCILLVIFSVIAIGAFYLNRRVDPRNAKLHGVLGVLIGLGTACLVMGVCFVAR